MTTTNLTERTVTVSGKPIFFAETGTGPAVVMLHGGGPGASGVSNYSRNVDALARHFRVIVPDMPGYGRSIKGVHQNDPFGYLADMIRGLLDELCIDTAHLIGNSYGGAAALRLALDTPDRVGKLVLMGSMGVSFPITEGLDRVWGYEPSLENMRKVLDVFAYSRDIVNDELAEVRYRASIQPGFQESFAAMFPAPRQRWVAAMCTPEEEIRQLPHRALIIHGREDKVIPVQTSLRLMELIDNGDLAVYSHCGHWSMIERNRDFNRAVHEFLTD